MPKFDRILAAIGNLEHAEALLQEYEQSIVPLSYANSVAVQQGWSDKHRRIAQLVVLAASYEALTSDFVRMQQTATPTIIVQPPQGGGAPPGDAG